MRDRMEIDLAGEWRFAMDPNEKGSNLCGGWFQETLPDRVTLPGTTSQNMVGIESKIVDKLGVIERFTYRGVAWYQRDVAIPSDWRDKHVELRLERANNTAVWLDDILVGRSDLLQADQIFDLTGIAAPGKHTITIRNDNSRVRPVHGYRFDFLNGICGAITLTAADKIHIKDVRVTPNIDQKTAVIYFTLRNQTRCQSRGDVLFRIRSTDGQHRLRPYRFEYMMDYDRDEKEFELCIYMGEQCRLWDEFSPTLYQVEMELRGLAGQRAVSDSCSTRFGMRRFEARGRQFAVNGKTVFLRGDALLHEKYMYRTGRSLYSKADWLEVMKIYKEYGINYLRFHTHCPPRAVFEAADEMGIYVQPELTIGGTNGMNVPGPDSPYFDPLLEPAARRWGAALLQSLHNHPSFVMLTLGNEINGDRPFLERMVEYLREMDPSRLYAQGSNNFIRRSSLSANDDFWSTMKVKPSWEFGNVRGSYAHSDLPLGPVQDGAPRNSLRDFNDLVEEIPVPLIAFELGQYETSCSFDEIERFPEMELPGSLMRYRRMMEERGLLHKEKDFYRDSGAACLLCYREDIETVLRTREMAGFQVLSLADIHTDGTAVDGILNAFLENKGMVSAQEWRRCCGEHAVLLRIGKYLFNDGEQANICIQFANYGPAGIEKARPYWELRLEGKAVNRETLDPVNLPQGALTDMAQTRITLSAREPVQYTLRVGIEDTELFNDYHIWVYPAQQTAESVFTTRDPVQAAKELALGNSVLLYTDIMESGKSVEGFFATNFWSYDMFATASENCWETRPGQAPIGTMKAPGTMGISYDPTHPVFRYMPGEGHTDYQWFQIIMSGNSIVLNDFDSKPEPIIWTIDTPHRCWRLGLLFELQVGEGRLMVCGTDLSALKEDQPAQGLLRGIYEYMQSDGFRPRHTCTPAFFNSFFCGRERQ